jgi:tripartite-type tricarboxylate transporter receptor subunit TctC
MDLLGGHIDSLIITLAAVTEHVRAGRLDAIAVTTPYRSQALPEVPTVAESGLPAYAIESWQGLVAPAKTPRPIVQKLNALFVSALNAPDVKSFLENQGFVVRGSTPEELDETIRNDIPRYAKVIAASGMKID